MHRLSVKLIRLAAIGLAAGGALFSVVAVTARPANADDQAIRRKIARLSRVPEPSGELISAREIDQQREALQQFAYRDRELVVWLSEAEDLINDDQAEAALQRLQRILEHSQDGFLYRAPTSEAVGARAEAIRWFEQLDSDVIETYEALYGGAADKQLRDALRSGDLVQFQRISRSSFHTSAGFKATHWLASWWMDHGQYGSAARCWDRLFDSRVHRQRVQRVHRLKAAMAYRLNRQHAKADSILAQVNHGGVLPAAFSGSSPRAVTRAAFYRPSPQKTDQWKSMLGDPSRVSARPGSFPYLRPRWTHELLTPQSDATPERELRNQMARWNSDQLKEGRPVAVAQYPVAVRGQVVFRDPHGICAVDAKTGDRRWRYDCQTSLIKLINQPTRRSRQKTKLVDWIWSGNANWGMLASDGHRVFAVDELELTWNPIQVIQGKVRADPSRERRKSNRLIALDLKSSGAVAKPLWSVGGRRDSRKAPSTLAGHFFLGPPLPVHGRLYTVTEHNHRIYLHALDPETGGVIWSQGIALVDLPIHSDRKRYPLSCTPSYSNGIVVCPTQLGVVVAVDETTGDLLWGHYYGDLLPEKQFGRMPHRHQEVYGHAGFPDVPLIAAGCVVTMPRQSKYIHCLGLADGSRQWRAPRDDAEYVATISNQTVLVIGRHTCRGLSLSDGSELWSARFGMCAGRGVQVEQDYVLPLANGSVANFDIDTGRRLGFTRTHTDTRMGNLILQDGYIYSLAYDTLAALPQAGLVRDELQSKINRQNATSDEILQAGELELVLGRPEPAKALMKQALHHRLSDQSTDDAESLLREALYLQLESEPLDERDESGLLSELAEISRTPDQQARYLVLQAEFELRRADYASAVRAALELADLPIRRPIPLTSQKRFAVTQASWIPHFLSRVLHQADPESAGQIRRIVDDRRDRILAQGNEDDLKRFVATFATFPQANLARLALADNYMTQGRFQPAEFLLMAARQSDDAREAGVATAALVELYSRRQVYSRAQLMLDDLSRSYAATPLVRQANGRELAAQLAEQYLLRSDEQGGPKAAGKISNVSIEEDRWPQFDLERIYSNLWQPLKVPVESEFELRPTGKHRARTLLWQVHRQTGVPLAALNMPQGFVPPSAASTRHSFCGHFFPAGSEEGGVMYGVSLLNPPKLEGKSFINPPTKRVMWTTVAPEMSEHAGRILPGPSGPNYCTFQSTRQLLALNPANGEILWHRSDIQPGGGKFADRGVGLFGDDNVLVLFGHDQQSFTVYETATGVELKQGRLDVARGEPRRLIGRNLLHVCRENGQRWLRLWDPLTDEFLCNEPLIENHPAVRRGNSSVVPVKFSDNFAILSDDIKGIRVIDGRTGEVKLDVPLSKQELAGLKQLGAFADDKTIYLNLQRHIQGGWRVNSFAGESYLPYVRVNGELRAYDRDTGRQRWTARIPQCVIPRIGGLQEPVLITLSRTSWRGRYFLQVGAYDARTGQQLGKRRDLLDQRIVQASYDPAQRTLTLRSLKSRITLKFHNRPLLDGSGELRLAEAPRPDSRRR